jgi:multidrug efflux pump subunit AcrA (membrane-fusion protein)
MGGCRRGAQDGGSAPDATKHGGDTGKGSDVQRAESDSSGEQRTGGPAPTDTVRISREDQPRAGIQIAAVTVQRMPRTLMTAGQVAMDERRTNHIGALADGRIERVYVLPGDAVRAGQTLATLHSHTVHETVAALLQAFAAVSRQQSAVIFATQARDRYAKLYSIQAASLEEKQRSEQDLAQAKKDLTDADASVRAEREHLAELLQVPPQSLQPDTIYDRELIPVRAVSAGFVINRNVTPGQVVSTGDEAFVTSDLATVWVNAAVNEKDVPELHRGASVTVTTQANAGEGLKGTVAMLGDVVDPQTRTLPVRVSVPNPGTRLRPGMFVTAAISEPRTQDAIFVPEGALQDIDGFRVVFLTTDGVTFHARAVKIGIQTGGLVEITEGLSPSDHVVVAGAFMVKGELLKGTVGEG